ncbi:MAG: FHA domain-containing protein [Caldilineaceae bacterium]
MTLHQTDQTNVGRVSQTNSNDTAQVAQPVATAVDATNAPAAAPETQVGQTLDTTTSLPEAGIFAPQNVLQTVLLSLVVLLSIIVIWLLRRRQQIVDAGFEVLAAEPAIAPDWRDAYAQRQPTLITTKAKPPKAPAMRVVDVDEEGDTSKLASVNKFDFEDEATFVLAPKANNRLLGHLIRVTSEPRFPAELELMSVPSARTDESEIAIGRHSKHNAVVIPDKSVSRQHAMIVQRGEKLFVRDNRSTAGTMLNWKPIHSDDEQPLRDKDILSIGEAVYEFRAKPAEASGSQMLVPTFAQNDTEKIEN